MECYYRHDHHIFCSRNCHLGYKRDELRTRIVAVAQKRISLPLAIAMIIIAIAPTAIVSTQAAIELDAPMLHWLVKHRREVAVQARIEAIEESDVRMTIRGTATPGAVIFLLRDGTAVANAAASGSGGFAFELPLSESAATFAVAAVARSAVASAAFVPDRPETISRVLEASVRSNRAEYVASFTRGGRAEPEMVLSFDAGSTDRGAVEILDALRSAGVRTTIFLTGDFITRYPAMARRIVADGHEVGNHTFSHPHLTTFETNRKQITLRSMTRERFQDELRRTADAFQQATGTELSPMWRAPFGEENSEIRGWAAELGYLHVGWTRGPKYNLDSLDWVVDRKSPLYYSSQQISDRMMQFGDANGTTLNGSIALLHLGTDRGEDERLARMLPVLIQRIQEKGLKLVKVSQLRGET